ncbi:MAG: ATP synthase F1 subunit gamma [Candidatus Hydrogenedentes bacterium]|nr:ATP synthase F1 subunit gamma [Candidatus Hydrogenedentota bacterium]
MASLRDIRRRIASVKNTQKITRAMKMVAAAKLRRAQEAIQQARPYAYHMRDLVNRLALRVDEGMHPLLRRGNGGKVGLIVVTSDRGLCGGFNSNIVNAAMATLSGQFKGREVELTVVGRKGRDALRRRPCTIRKEYTGVMVDSPWRAAGAVIDDIVADFVKGETDAVYCLYNEFKSAIAQRVTLEPLLPFEPPTRGEIVIDYLYEPSAEGLIGALLTRHMQVQMHRILFESAASEHGARMTAMDAATTNAGDVIERLTLKYNRARQTAITTEMIEIVSGAEAL